MSIAKKWPEYFNTHSRNNKYWQQFKRCHMFVLVILSTYTAFAVENTRQPIEPCAATLSSISATEACLNANVTITLNGLVPNSLSLVSYSKSGIIQLPVSVAANSEGVGMFQTLATSVSQVLIITMISRTDVVPSCNFVPVANNSVTLQISAGCTVVVPAQCGNTLPAIDSYVYASLVSFAEAYRWRVTTLTGVNAGQVQLAQTALRSLRITQLPTFAFDTQYKFEVATFRSGAWSPYGPVCNVRTPAATTQLIACAGPPLIAMGDSVFAFLVSICNRIQISDFRPV